MDEFAYEIITDPEGMHRAEFRIVETSETFYLGPAAHTPGMARHLAMQQIQKMQRAMGSLSLEPGGISPRHAAEIIAKLASPDPGAVEMIIQDRDYADQCVKRAVEMAAPETTWYLQVKQAQVVLRSFHASSRLEVFV